MAHEILLNETNRTVALAIAYANDAKLGAEILYRFTLDRQVEIVRQIAKLSPDDNLSSESNRTVALVIAYVKDANLVTEILAQFSPDRQEEIVCQQEEITHEIAKLSPDNILLNESNRTVALVIAYTKNAELGEEIFVRFTPNRQAEIIREIAGFSQDNISGIALACKLVGMLDHTTGVTILKTLCRNAPELAMQIRQRVFFFEEIALLDDHDIQILLLWGTGVRKLLPNALKGTSDELKERFFANMSKRAVVILKEDIEVTGIPTIKSTKEAQREIVQVLQCLNCAGELTLKIPELLPTSNGIYKSLK